MKKVPVKFSAFTVVLDDRHDRPLTVKRSPPYLRFVLVGDDPTTLDALDQLDDEASEDERLIAAEVVERTPIHLYGVFGGKRTGRWEQWVKYSSIPEQPPQSVMRDQGQWRAWCIARQAQARPL